jgi:YD repeat-containing protein
MSERIKENDMTETDSRMIITDESGQEREVDILLTFTDDKKKKNYVLFTDKNDPDGSVYAYTYDDDGNLNEVTDEKEWAMCQEVLGAFLKKTMMKKVTAMPNDDSRKMIQSTLMSSMKCLMLSWAKTHVS